MKALLSVFLLLLTLGCYPTKYNSFASKEGLPEAQRDVDVLKTSLKGKSPEELIASFIPDGPHKYGGYEYYYKYMANRAVQQELESRGGAAHAALRAHTNDNTFVWEAINGPGHTVGRICTKLLKE